MQLADQCLTQKTVALVITRLDKMVGNPESIYKSLLLELLVIKHITTDNPSAFLEFSNALRNLIDNMVLLKQEGFLNDQRLLNDLTSRFSTELRNERLNENRTVRTVR